MEHLANDGMTSRIIATLREKFPMEIDAEDSQRLSQTVREQIILARRHGFASEYGVATFVATAWMLGLGFDKKIPAVAECLAREDMSEEDRALWLEQFCVLLFTKLAEG
ncbi:MAG: hypothetical protein VBE63_26470 [Lamprobacter sp.]|uniref:hypothetical protein n=1 Tax=Lamprobacter sp. TaxID=3100796 RepID=UPI002B25DC00|nr:hypothetical protein [Lamprobacter sp.]MEA3643450.1 hypothetical protein [Lamprobacter sp.]